MTAPGWSGPMPPHPPGRTIRVPLPGDPFGIDVTFPDRLLSAEEWSYFWLVLDVATARCPTCRKERGDLSAIALACPDGFHDAPAVSLQSESETA